MRKVTLQLNNKVPMPALALLLLLEVLSYICTLHSMLRMQASPRTPGLELCPAVPPATADE
eukprot:1075430-Pelagomonas_calceolata.AAC.4